RSRKRQTPVEKHLVDANLLLWARYIQGGYSKNRTTPTPPQKGEGPNSFKRLVSPGQQFSSQRRQGHRQQRSADRYWPEFPYPGQHSCLRDGRREEPTGRLLSQPRQC